MSPVHQCFLGQRSWILSSMNPPTVTKNRQLDAVVHELLNLFSEQKLENLMKETHSFYVFSS